MSFFRHLIVLSFLGLATANMLSCQEPKKYNIPAPGGYVSDFEKLLSDRQKKHLDSAILAFEKATTGQISIVTIDTPMVARKNFDDYVFQIANAWGVGHKGKDNGVIVGISKGYRMMRIDVGVGFENRLSDQDCKMIIDTAFIPSFKKGLYFDGISRGLQAIIKKLQ